MHPLVEHVTTTTTGVGVRDKRGLEEEATKVHAVKPDVWEMMKGQWLLNSSTRCTTKSS